MHARTLLQKRQIKAEEVVILNDIGITLLNQRAEFANQARLIFLSRCLQYSTEPSTIQYGYKKYTPAMRI